MSSKSKFKPLEVGDRVFIESRSFYDRQRPSLQENIVIEANRSSAYICPVYGNRPKYTEKRFCKRVQQKDGKVIAVLAGYHDILWRSEEQFNRYYMMVERKKQYIQQATDKLYKMSIKELEVFLEVNND
ncbi:hypothetical protein CPT_Stills7 [Bacillus phage Stills]|uniref:Uncharacterized protein n=1 Tax=Bacillus phage Stills TaxID=1610833 RepID=A0A0E3T7J4_9CAUD|nr:hypothetical protein CPT_Stills7 [Bacillus phage Stills]AKC02635.1 hypothetical protein CPT_Stills7 [Bacillus phage Stills]